MNTNAVDVVLNTMQSAMTSKMEGIVGAVAAVVLTAIGLFAILFAARKVEESADTPWENL